MKIIFLLLLSCGSAFAQDAQLGVTGSFLSNSGGGYNDFSLGVQAHVIQPVLPRVTLAGQFGYENSKKVLIDSGFTLRGRLDARVNALSLYNPDLTLFGSVGVNASRLITNQYSKGAVQPALGLGVNYQDLLVLRASYLLSEHQTLNRVRGVRAGADVYLPISPASRFNYLFGLEYQQWNFYQPTGPAKGWNTGRVVALQVGVSWKHER